MLKKIANTFGLFGVPGMFVKNVENNRHKVEICTCEHCKDIRNAYASGYEDGYEDAREDYNG